MLPYNLFDAESTSFECMKHCISRSNQIDMSVTNRAQISEGVCEGKLRAIIKRGGRLLV